MATSLRLSQYQPGYRRVSENLSKSTGLGYVAVRAEPVAFDDLPHLTSHAATLGACPKR